jgi:hypothetical protein
VLYDPKGLNSGMPKADTLHLGREFSLSPRRVTFFNSPKAIPHCVARAISRRWAVPFTRVFLEQPTEARSYNCNLAEPVERLDKLTGAEFEAQLHVTIEPQVFLREVYVLTGAGLSSQIRRSLNNEPPVAESLGIGIIGIDQPIGGIVRELEFELEEPVIDETGLTGKVDYSAVYHSRGFRGALDLAHQLGLELTEAVRPIEMLVVRRTQ